MASHRIVCTDQEPVTAPRTHQHIVAVGVGTDPDKADARWTLNEVLEALDRGDSFYTKGVKSGKIAYVEAVYCGVCNRRIIRSKPDAVADNNLDNLRDCRPFN